MGSGAQPCPKKRSPPFPTPVRGGPSALLAGAQRLLGARKMPVTELRFHDHGLEEFRLLFPLLGERSRRKSPAVPAGEGSSPGASVAGTERGPPG